MAGKKTLAKKGLCLRVGVVFFPLRASVGPCRLRNIFIPARPRRVRRPLTKKTPCKIGGGAHPAPRNGTKACANQPKTGPSSDGDAVFTAARSENRDSPPVTEKKQARIPASARPSLAMTIDTATRRTYLDMVLSSVASVRSSRGASLPALKKAVTGMLPSGKEAHAPSLRKALDAAVKGGLVERDKASYKITPEGRAQSKKNKRPPGASTAGGKTKKASTRRTAASPSSTKKKSTKPRTRKAAPSKKTSGRSPAKKRTAPRVPQSLSAALKLTGAVYDDHAKRCDKAVNTCLRALFREFPDAQVVLHPAAAGSAAPSFEVMAASDKASVQALLARFVAVHGSSLMRVFENKTSAMRSRRRGGYEVVDGACFEDEDDGSDSDGTVSDGEGDGKKDTRGDGAEATAAAAAAPPAGATVVQMEVEGTAAPAVSVGDAETKQQQVPAAGDPAVPAAAPTTTDNAVVPAAAAVAPVAGPAMSTPAVPAPAVDKVAA